MSPQRWREIQELYHSARESGAAVLAGADPELRGIVEKLLAQDSETGGKLLDQRAADLFNESPLTPGTRLGPYQIQNLLGEGGMGQVFRATDTRLGRSVAIKISREPFSDRFEREARVIAALNHPNICTLHDVGPDYLVMELMQGETLLERLKRGKLSVSQTIQYGAQIADALAAAHAQGIVHRDLKPGNVMLTKSGVKVLDFGLAKSAQDVNLTGENSRMGTPAYMAPEQFEGTDADPRSDIYGLGLILGEMAMGKRIVTGSPEAVPPVLERVIRKCLEKDPDDRWQSARDLKWELEWAAGAPITGPSRPPHLLLAGALALVILLLAALAFIHFREQPSPAEPVRMSVLLPEKSRVLSLAVSPDGHEIAMVLVKEGTQQIWIRSLDALEPTPLPGTDDAADPFWSPDGHYIGFFADAKLKKIERSGGPVQTLCDALAANGGSWNRNGDILMGGLFHVQRIAAAGGALSDLTKWSAAFPVFLPDGRHYLATRGGRAGSPEAGIWLLSMNGPEVRRILPDSSNAQVIDPPAGSRVGTVLFTRAGTLMALPFDMNRLEAAGDPVPAVQQIAPRSNLVSLASASRHGVLAYVLGQRGSSQYVWRDRQGKNLGIAGNAGAVVAISPDGKRLVGGHNGTWVLEFGRGIATQLGFGTGNTNPIWSADGRYIAYTATGGIYRQVANGARPGELLVHSKTFAAAKSWSPDGRFLMYVQVNPGTGADLLAIPVEPDAKPFVVVQTPANEDQGQFSPDGHWVAYTSNESGLSEIYVIPFPPSANDGKWMVSRGGGVQPRWRRDGKELFYISPDSKMMAVDVNTRLVFQSGTPHPLFLTEIVDTGIRTGPMSWDVAPDGRFLIITAAWTDPSLNVVLNWRAPAVK